MDIFKNLLNQLKARVKSLKKEVKTLFLAYKRPDVPWYAKLFSILVVGYVLSPVDLIPDFVPILGYLDDLVLIPLGVALAIKMIPPKIIEECREQAEDVFKDGKPKNWVAGAAIISIWAVVIVLIVIRVL